LIGGRVQCAACQSIGLIAKAGGPARSGFYGAEVALEGDVVVCHCPVPQPLISNLQNLSSADDLGPEVDLFAALPSAAGRSDLLLPARLAQKVVDQEFAYANEYRETKETICPNLTNKEFAELALTLRDEAPLLAGQRTSELERWDKKAQASVLEWFGDPGFLEREAHLSDLRKHLMLGLVGCARVLGALMPENFVRWSPTAHEHVGCVNPHPNLEGVAAQVCKPDVKTHTVAIALPFCELRRSTKVYGTDTYREGDSQLLTLIHEVTHFDDTFGSSDLWNGAKNARAHAADPASRNNADSLALYILGVTGL
jgi:hypothetical protein